MASIKLLVTDGAYILATGLALVYADDNWNEFAKSMGMDKSDEVDELHAELQHFIATFLFENIEILAVLLTEWGEERLTNYIVNLTNHTHKNGETHDEKE